MFQNHFDYIVQETGDIKFMTYEEYLNTPSAAGRQLNKW
jgi:hypothetical protein